MLEPRPLLSFKVEFLRLEKAASSFDKRNLNSGGNLPMLFFTCLLKSLVYEIRGQKVMLDFDLARIYGYETRDFNNQVKHNAKNLKRVFAFA